VLAILSLSSVAVATSTPNAGDKIITRLNNGVVIKKVADVDVVTEIWNQSFLVPLPSLNEPDMEVREMNCTTMPANVTKAEPHAYV